MYLLHFQTTTEKLLFFFFYINIIWLQRFLHSFFVFSAYLEQLSNIFGEFIAMVFVFFFKPLCMLGCYYLHHYCSTFNIHMFDIDWKKYGELNMCEWRIL